jgi:hypothetical protein
MPEYLYATRQMHPVAGIDVTIGGTLTSGVAFGDGQAAAWLAILQALDLVRVSEGSARYYVGALRPQPRSAVRRLRLHPVDPASTGFGARTAVVVGGVVRPPATDDRAGGARARAHDGRRHAPCGAMRPRSTTRTRGSWAHRRPLHVLPRSRGAADGVRTAVPAT